MKNLYTTLLAGAALLMAGGVDAQSINSKTDHQARAPKLTAAGAGGHHVVSAEFRGGGPANDNCSSVTFENLSGGGTLTFTGDNTGATETGDFEAGSGLDGFGPTVWHGFTTTECTNITVAYCGTASVFQNVAAFLARTCPATDADYVLFAGGNFTDCADGNATIQWVTVDAGSYYLPVLLDEAAPAVGPYTITVTAEACASAPANDECAGATSIPVGSWCNPIFFSGDGATESLAGIDCNGFTGDANDDIWFSFVATATDMTFGAIGADDGDGDNNTGYDPVIEVFDACGGNSLGCADATLGSEAEEVQLTGLTVGATYFARVYHWYTAPQEPNSVGICVVEGAGIGIGIEESAIAEWSVYPNPGTGVFNLQYAGASTVGTIEVIDVTGRVVFSQQAQFNNGTIRTMDLSGLANGNYNVRLTANGERTEQRLVKN